MPWKRLQLSPAAGTHLPALLISTAFVSSSSSYTVYLTDLTHIWSESLSKQEILRRSRAENTSIDPNNTDQFKIFLQKIQFGLEGGRDSTLSLTINSDPDRPSLVLHICVHLPGGLLPLEWPIQLNPSSQQLLSSQLTVPLLRAQHKRLQELVGLAEALKEKDHVIQKLLDKLEEQGTDLGQMFPHVAGRPGRKVDRKRAEERVKGLGPFDLKSWEERLQGDEVTQTVTELFGEVSQDFTGKAEAGEVESDNWWDDLGGVTVNLSTGKISTKGVSRDRRPPPTAPPSLPVQDSIDESDDFQVQLTPPHLFKAAPVVEDSTDDDDDLDAPSQRSKLLDNFPVSQPTRPSPPPKVTRNLGIIGKKRLKTPEPEPDPTLDEETASEDESPPISPPAQAAGPPQCIPIPSPPPQPKPNKALGRIGGKKEPPAPPPEPSSSPSPPRASSSPNPTKSKLGKIGKIGGKKTVPPLAATAQKEASPVPSPAPTTEPPPKRKLGTIGHHTASVAPETKPAPAPKEEETPEPEPEKEETAEEKADRKRALLKRELEEKSRAPVKKKRKF